MIVNFVQRDSIDENIFIINENDNIFPSDKSNHFQAIISKSRYP